MKSVGKIITLILLIVAVSYTSFNSYAQENEVTETREMYENEALDQKTFDNVFLRKEASKVDSLDINRFENDNNTEEIQKISNKVKETSFERLSGSVSRFLIYTSPEKYEYLSGEEIIFYVGLSIAEDSGISEDTVLEVSIPKNNIAKGTFNASDINSQTSKTIFEDEENYIVRYLFPPLKSGTSLGIPIKLKTLNGDTPNGFIVDVTSKLMNNNFKVLILQKMKNLR